MENVKIIYQDHNVDKILKGRILKEDDNFYYIEGSMDKNVVILGKRFIIKISEIFIGDSK